MRILGPRSCARTFTVTAPSPSSTSGLKVLPSSALTRSTTSVSPSRTRYCFPPSRMIAYSMTGEDAGREPASGRQCSNGGPSTLALVHPPLAHRRVAPVAVRRLLHRRGRLFANLLDRLVDLDRRGRRALAHGLLATIAAAARPAPRSLLRRCGRVVLLVREGA